MRKQKHSVKKLGRATAHRHATLSNLSTELIRHKRIRTTEAKAKALRPYVERLITKAKKGTMHAQREVFKVIRDKAVIKELFGEVANKVANRNGGYTRIIKLPPRFGDAAKMAYIELVDYGAEPNVRKAQKQDRARRVRGSKEALAKSAGEQKEASASA
ncbi:MAG: 50S ribosomal protein L17 [Chloroherpetonaceae bacterium]|nr:50S ribosomal protein L17 [Chloroherpetonaceae bacterium]